MFRGGILKIKGRRRRIRRVSMRREGQGGKQVTAIIHSPTVFTQGRKKENKGREKVPNRKKEVSVVKIRHQGALLGRTRVS